MWLETCRPAERQLPLRRLRESSAFALVFVLVVKGGGFGSGGSAFLGPSGLVQHALVRSYVTESHYAYEAGNPYRD